MTASNESNLGLNFGWAYGEDNWNTGMDANMVVLGGMTPLYVKSRATASKPVSPTNGDRYYVPVGATGDWSSYEKNIAIYSTISGWKYVPCKKGFEFRIENESNLSVYFDGTNLVDSVDGSGYLTSSSVYTATGQVTFSTIPKISGTHSIDTTEVANLDDIDTAIAAQDFSTHVKTSGAQSIAGVKTFTSPISGVDAVAASDLTTLSQVETLASATTYGNLGAGVAVPYEKFGDVINFKTLIGGTNVNIVDGGEGGITINAAGLGVDTFLEMTDTPSAYTGQSGKVVSVNSGETALEFTTLSSASITMASQSLATVSYAATIPSTIHRKTTVVSGITELICDFQVTTDGSGDVLMGIDDLTAVLGVTASSWSVLNSVLTSTTTPSGGARNTTVTRVATGGAYDTMVFHTSDAAQVISIQFKYIV